MTLRLFIHHRYEAIMTAIANVQNVLQQLATAEARETALLRATLLEVRDLHFQVEALKSQETVAPADLDALQVQMAAILSDIETVAPAAAADLPPVAAPADPVPAPAPTTPEPGATGTITPPVDPTVPVPVSDLPVTEPANLGSANSSNATT